jgi:uncharacterized oligopeptide transporter (OPT) family protein
VIGALLGALLAVVNTYVGLKTGITDSGNVTSVLLGFAIGAVLVRAGAAAFTAHELNTIQTTATAAGGMANTIGLSGAASALYMMGAAPSPFALAVLGLCAALLAIGVAVALRAALIEQRPLPFPSGQVTAQLIGALQRDGRGGGVWPMTITAAVTAIVVWFRDAKPELVPDALSLPAPGAYTTPAAAGYGVATSPLLLGVGFLVGAPTALAIALGSVVAWLGLGPWLVEDRGLAPTYDALAGWLVWPGLALILAGSITSLVRDRRVLGGGGLARPSSRLIAAGVAVIGMTVAIATLVLDATILALLIGIGLAPVLGLIGARVAGESDISPAGPLGAIAQVAVTPVASTASGILVPAAVASGVVVHSATALWALKAGHLLGASWRNQVIALVIGSVVGTAVAMPVFALLRDAHTIGSPDLPVPFAQTSAATTRALLGGSDGVPDGAGIAALVAAACGIALAFASGPGARRFVPSPTAVGIGFLLPVSYGAPILIGGLLAALIARARSQAADTLPMIGTGAILGEALLGVIIAGLKVGGVI